MRQSILILGHSYATQFIDVFNQYTRLFDPDKYEVTVAYLTGEENLAVKQRTLAEHVLFLNESKKNIRNLKIGTIRKLLALHKQKKFQIVICHRYKPIYLMMWVTQFYKIPALICVMHELHTMSSLGRRLLIAGLRRNNMLLAGVSNAVRDDLRKSLWFVPKKYIITLYNVIDVELTEPQLLTSTQARSILNLPAESFVFGNIARLVPNKDQVSLIKAFAGMRSSCPNALLIIMGDGELQISLKQLVKDYQLDNQVIFTGFLDNAMRYMKAFDCFILSSIQEAFGRVLLEAMIAKRPIIATQVNGIPEVVAHTGLLIQAKDIIALEAAMKQVYHRSLQEHLQQGEQAYQRAINYYSIPIFQKDFWQLPLLQAIKENH
ncbi:MAG: hypothetical protein A3F11_07595 [Gammaproteobacteria bacterium RIFCSPHIGHO2_12_FULL_37_14]|nr:MAG: hypothetical protein A3F11_07595 [Gammaproteobacteria bacterium RIFCSPHIGHO2_12_FULL_37_14]